MKLSSMRFKNYVWPHNPRTYEIVYRRTVAAHGVPFGKYVLQNMGRRHRVLRGSGEFAGPGAYAEFKKLAAVFYDPTPGVLVHPLWDQARAWFVALRLDQEPTEDYVRYSFEFWECYDEYREGLQSLTATASSARSTGVQYHTVAAGESLWSIANASGVSLSRLLALNPQLRNPNRLTVGQAVRVK